MNLFCFNKYIRRLFCFNKYILKMCIRVKNHMYLIKKKLSRLVEFIIYCKELKMKEIYYIIRIRTEIVTIRIKL